MKKYLIVLFIFLIAPQAHATTYYADLTNGNDASAGTATTSAFLTITQFANNARSAGDILIVRRGTQTAAPVAATFTSSGTLNAPITISADYDNLWGNQAVAGGGFASTSETYTPTAGSTYVASSASSTVAFPNMWVYFQGDCQERAYKQVGSSFGSTTPTCAFAYEIASTSPDGVSLYLPYRGNQSGAGTNIRVMGKAPIIGTLSQANQVLTGSLDDYWSFKGLDLRSTIASCVVSMNAAKGTTFFDDILQGNGAGDCGFSSLDNGTMIKKNRMYNFVHGFSNSAGPNFLPTIEDFYMDCNSVASSDFYGTNNAGSGIYAKNGIVTNCTNLIAANLGSTVGLGPSTFINVRHNNTFTALSGGAFARFYFEDNYSTTGLNSQVTNQVSANTVSTTTVSTTTPLRAGGGPRNEAIFPPSGTGNTGVSAQSFPFSYIKLFEYPIYAAASASKTYTMYFTSTSTGNFTTDPLTATAIGSTTPELYIECEYYGDATDANRLLKRSNTSGQATFSTDTNWHGISVTCNPLQSGILYLRGWYAKPREVPSNIFYMDTTPIIQ